MKSGLIFYLRGGIVRSIKVNKHGIKVDEILSVTFPHCDPRILHPKGQCKYCDESGLQEVREAWNINYTEEKQNENKLPCPAIEARGLDGCQQWRGNVPKKEN